MAQLDAAYEPFPPFSEWPQNLPRDDLWEEALGWLLQQKASRRFLTQGARLPRFVFARANQPLHGLMTPSEVGPRSPARARADGRARPSRPDRRVGTCPQEQGARWSNGFPAFRGGPPPSSKADPRPGVGRPTTPYCCESPDPPHPSMKGDAIGRQFLRQVPCGLANQKSVGWVNVACGAGQLGPFEVPFSPRSAAPARLRHLIEGFAPSRTGSPHTSRGGRPGGRCSTAGGVLFRTKCWAPPEATGEPLVIA